MSPNGLEATIRVEQEVHARIAAEQKKAELWTKEQKAALEQTIAAELRALGAEEEQAQERLRKDYAKKAAAHLHQVEELALFFETKADFALQPLIQKILLATLPGFEP